ncbi:hypothetical protein EVAR_70142_1 [Eumeta japonica]|uniref:Uncharacterized protein n=1 Tax=Eumeta variegata TaxID=151549 RepID=A0A4C1ST98_EUMVA|nr:hypothetical protein EVAR_70142_1 [Eumeta japonica]
MPIFTFSGRNRYNKDNGDNGEENGEANENVLLTTTGTVSPTLRIQTSDPAEQEIAFELPSLSSTIAETNDEDIIDLLSIFQQDTNKPLNEIQDEELDITLSPLPTPPRAPPVMNISDLIQTNSSDIANDLEFSLLVPQQTIEPPNQPRWSFSPSKTVRRSARRQDQKRLVPNEQSASTATVHRTLYQYDTPPAAPKRLKPRTYISEDEYCLRFACNVEHFLKLTVYLK